MNTNIWILQGLMAFVFLYSGMSKAFYDENTLVKKGQTGVEGLPRWLIKFIGVSEILGAFALVLPMFMNKWTFLTPLAAICLGFIMIPAAVIHQKRREYKNVFVNLVVFVICCFIAYYRF